MGEIIYYRAIYPYDTSHESEMALQAGDILEVRKPFPFPLEGTETHPKGWVYGYNQSSQKVGFFPGTFVEYLKSESAAGIVTSLLQRPVPRPFSLISSNTTAAPPSSTCLAATSVPSSEDIEDSGYLGSPAAAGSSRRSFYQHQLVDVFFVTPIFCKHCRDYIWGRGKVGMKCEDCQACFHIVCVPHSSSVPCYPSGSSAVSELPATVDHDVPITQWSVVNVVEWMAALRLYRYAELFRSKDIKGIDLISLDKEKLMNMGIKDDFHQRAILVCIDELCQRPSSISPPANMAPNLGGSPTYSFEEGGNHAHKLSEKSFSTVVQCDKCHWCLRGLIHQGFLCQACGLVCHRTCAATGLPSCNSSNLSYRQHLLSTVFGRELSSQFNSAQQVAPNIVLQCIQELENQAQVKPGLDLYKVYRTSAPSNVLSDLKLKFNSAEQIDLSGFEPSCIASALKKYLRELPNPLIPVEFYDKFIEASRLGKEESCTLRLRQLVQQLPIHHKTTLQTLMAHLCRVCQLQHHGNKCNEPPTVLTQVFCHILLRPPWESILQVVNNTEAHLKIVELLLLKGDWGEQLPDFGTAAPAIPPRRLSRGSQPPPNFQHSSDASSVPRPPPPSSAVIGDAVPQTIEEAEWYWGGITREEVNEKLKDCPDGSFLVRDASNKGSGEYTLTLRKGGINKLIKIYHNDGKYGFAHPLTYNSVVDLINYHRNMSLRQYNRTLDIKLLYPISRFHQEEDVDATSDVETVAQRLKVANLHYQQKNRLYDQYYEDYNRTIQEIMLKKQAADAFHEALLMFEEQLKAHEMLKTEALSHEVEMLQKNRELLVSRYQAVQASKSQLDAALSQQMAYSRTLDREINALKPEMVQLYKKREQYQSWLISKGVKKERIDKLLQDSSAQAKDVTRESAFIRGDELLPHHDETTWFLRECSRQKAEELLNGKSDGTFLVRTSSKGQYALSIVADSRVQHCIIEETDDGCYGFAEPYNIHPNLKSLVLHYAQTSLEEHNDKLRTTLAHPVFAASSPQPVLPPQQPDAYVFLQS